MSARRALSRQSKPSNHQTPRHHRIPTAKASHGHGVLCAEGRNGRPSATHLSCVHRSAASLEIKATQPKCQISPIDSQEAIDPNKEVYVPEGWFLQGGDNEAIDPLPRQQQWVGSFIIQKSPVSIRQYMQFLNSLCLLRAVIKKPKITCPPNQSAKPLFNSSK